MICYVLFYYVIYAVELSRLMYLILLYLLYVIEIKLLVLKLVLCSVKAYFRLYNLNLSSI